MAMWQPRVKNGVGPTCQSLLPFISPMCVRGTALIHHIYTSSMLAPPHCWPPLELPTGQRRETTHRLADIVPQPTTVSGPQRRQHCPATPPCWRRLAADHRWHRPATDAREPHQHIPPPVVLSNSFTRSSPCGCARCRASLHSRWRGGCNAPIFVRV
jgi:hypothetical protein